MYLKDGQSVYDPCPTRKLSVTAARARFEKGVRRTKYLKSLSRVSDAYIFRCKVNAMRKACLEYMRAVTTTSDQDVEVLGFSAASSPHCSLPSSYTSFTPSSDDSWESVSSVSIKIEDIKQEDNDVKIEEFVVKEEDIITYVPATDILVEEPTMVDVGTELTWDFFDRDFTGEYAITYTQTSQDLSEMPLTHRQYNWYYGPRRSTVFSQTPSLSLERQSDYTVHPPNHMFNGIWLPRDMFVNDEDNDQQQEEENEETRSDSLAMFQTALTRTPTTEVQALILKLL